MTARTAVPAALLLGALARPELRNLGASCEERRATLPGDDLVPGAHGAATMATTLPAPPAEVWPWLVQMGCDRAVFYSWDRLDNGGRPSADRIHPEWQDLREGDRIYSTPDHEHWFDVAVLDAPRTLVLRAPLSFPSGAPFDPSDARPPAYSDGIWSFHLRPTGDGRTRLVVRVRGEGRPRWLVGLVNAILWDPAHLIMQRRQFAQLRRRVLRADVG